MTWAAASQGLGGALLALAAVGVIGAVVAVSVGNDWINEGQRNGQDDQSQAGADLMLGGAVAFGFSAVVAFLGGLLFFFGRAQRREAFDGAPPPLPPN